ECGLGRPLVGENQSVERCRHLPANACLTSKGGAGQVEVLHVNLDEKRFSGLQIAPDLESLDQSEHSLHAKLAADQIQPSPGLCETLRRDGGGHDRLACVM